MDKVDNTLRRKIAEQQGSVAPRDALELALEDIDNDPNVDRVAVHFLRRNEDGGATHFWHVAGLTIEQHIALLALASRQAMDDWINEAPP